MEIKNGSGRVTLKDYFRSPAFIKTLVGIILGATAGFLYYIFIGCKSGTCPITSSPFGSIFTGALFGYLIAGLFNTEKKKE